MSRASQRLVRDTARLIDVTDDLCEVLRFYKEGSAEVAARVEQGEPLADALKEAGGPIRRAACLPASQ